MKIWLIAAFTVWTLQPYPSPFPREGVTKLLENEHVVVWHGVFPKNRPTAMHEHRLDLIGLFFSDGQVKTTSLDGSVREGKPFGNGHVVFQPRGVIHIEESLVEGTRALGIELKDTSGESPTKALPSELDPVKVAPHTYRILADNERVRVLEEIARPKELRPRHTHPGRLIVRATECLGVPTSQAAVTAPDGLRVWWVDAETHAPSGTAPQECRSINVEMKGT